MESGDPHNSTHEANTKPNPELDVDAVPADPVDFDPPVKDWIEYLAGRLAREITTSSPRSARSISVERWVFALWTFQVSDIPAP